MCGTLAEFFLLFLSAQRVSIPDSTTTLHSQAGQTLPLVAEDKFDARYDLKSSVRAPGHQLVDLVPSIFDTRG
ncbi:hypothetical protein ACPV5V_26070, partial [Vibrio campbellii]